MTSLQNYRGNKNIPGLFQWIINRIPPYKKMYEAFAGSAAITFKLNLPVPTVLNDCDPGVTDSLNCRILNSKLEHITIKNLPAVQLISSLQSAGTDTFVYCDPPYLLSTRGSNKKIYKHEMTDRQHKKFLLAVHTVNFNCMISHYECPMYNDYLKSWTREKKKVRYRGKTVEECIYYNYSKPTELMCYRFVGTDCWDRQRVTRKINRLTEKLLSLPVLERNAIINRVAAGTVKSNCNGSKRVDNELYQGLSQSTFI